MVAETKKWVSPVDRYKVQGLPDGKSGIWEVSHFTTDEKDRLYNFFEASRGRSVPPGTYTRLSRGGEVVMSDTPWEIRTNYWAIDAFEDPDTRTVFIAGLGIGMVLGAALRNPNIELVVVAELSEDVIRLVGPHYDDPRLHIVHKDVFDVVPDDYYKQGRWDVAWFDIWDNVTSDNHESMRTLTRRWARHCWASACWSRDLDTRWERATYRTKHHREQWRAKGRP